MRDLMGRVDFHIHVRPQEGMSAAAALSTCESKGYAMIGLVDHYDPATTQQAAEEVRREIARTRHSIEVFVGTEASVHIPDWPKESLLALRKEKLDFCLLAPSHHPRSREIPEFAAQPLESQSSWIYESFLESVRTDLADAVAHPFAHGKIPRLEEALSMIEDSDLRRALRMARRNRIAMDLSPRMLGVNRPFLTRFLELCKEVGVRFSIGSDAHVIENIGNDRLVLPLLREFGIGEEDIWVPRPRR